MNFLAFDLLMLLPPQSEFICLEIFELVKKNCTPYFPQTSLLSFSYEIVGAKLFQSDLSVALVKHTKSMLLLQYPKVEGSEVT